MNRPSPIGLYYDPSFIRAEDRKKVLQWLGTLTPLWERRYSAHHPCPEGQVDRPLLRPVYWLGNWQFACLGYYRPPRRTRDRCVAAEPFPPVLQNWVRVVEALVRKRFPPSFIPRGWTLNTCLVNLYGKRLLDGKWVDTARVGEHKDFEPGPVASISLGERALFQFVESRSKRGPSRVISQQWLDDGSLQVFAGPQWKDRLFHRVQRVDHRARFQFPISVDGFETRRVNFTFRYVPANDIVPYRKLSSLAAADVKEYMQTLSHHSEFFKQALQGTGP